MNYPSLTFTDRALGRIDDFVFGDLKLDLLIGSLTLDIMSRVICVDNIKARAELFDMLDSDAALLERFRRLFDVSAALERITNASSNASNEVTKALLYVYLCRRYCTFARLAAEQTDGVIGGELCGFFKKETEGDFDDFEKDSICLFDKCRAELTFEISQNADGSALGHAERESYGDMLKKAAHKLNIDLGDTGAYRPMLLDDLCREIISNNKELEGEITAFAEKYRERVTPNVADYKNQFNFYLELHDLIEAMRKKGLPAVRAAITEKPSITAYSCYDLTLTAKGETNIVPNDISLTGEERFCFLRGANGGGKTTYIRCIGANTLLAQCGCKVTAHSFAFSPFEGIYTHFPRDERFDRGGRLQDEEKRLEKILSDASERTLVLLNETFSTTMESTSREKTKQLAERLYDRRTLGIYVTHTDITEARDIPVLCVAIDKNDQNRRTFKVERQTEYTSSFAEDILRRYSLDRRGLEERFGTL